MIDILITTKCEKHLIYKALESLKEQSIIKSCNICVCYTGNSTLEKTNLAIFLKTNFQHSILIQDNYNFAKNNNRLAKLTNNEYILFLNDDVEFVRKDTLDYMVSIATLPTIGTVGIKLLYPNTYKIQHAGIFALMKYTGQFVGVSHLYLNKEVNSDNSDRYVIGNTAACMLIKRKLFDKIYFNEEYENSFEDVELNVKCLLKDYTNVCLNSIAALHHKSATRKHTTSTNDVNRIKKLFEDNFISLKKWIFLLDDNNQLIKK